MIDHLLVALVAGVVAWRAYMHGYRAGRLSVRREHLRSGAGED